MAIILNIETSTTNCSVSLSNDRETLVLKEDNSANYSHAETLHVFIKEVIEEAQISNTEIDAIAVSKGPGSYTGLRIGVSTAKGLCYALDKPLIAVPTLHSLAHQVSDIDGYIVPMLDARRMEVYSAVFDNNYKQIRATEAEVLEAGSFSNYLEERLVYFVGNGVEKTQTLIQHPNARFVENKMPSARDMRHISHHKYKISDIEDVAYFEPYYLKDFVAIKPK